MSGDERRYAQPKPDDMLEDARKAVDHVKKLQEAQLQQKEAQAAYETARDKGATSVRRNEEIGLAKTSLKELFGQIYKNPDAALEAFEKAGKQNGEATLTKRLAERPEAFGKLQGGAFFGLQTKDRASARELVKMSADKLVRLSVVAAEKPTPEAKLRELVKDRDQQFQKSEGLAKEVTPQTMRAAMREANYQLSNLQPQQINKLSPDQQGLSLAIQRQVKAMDSKQRGNEVGMSR